MLSFERFSRSIALLATLPFSAATAAAGPADTAPAALPAALCVVPPEPAVKPVVHPLTDTDTDGDKLDDLLNGDILGAWLTLTDPLASPDQRQAANEQLDEPVPVEFNFTRQFSQAEMDAFLAMGGQVTHIYKAVGYGWNGTLPRSEMDAAVAAMGPGFNGVVAARPMRASLYNATRTGRARPVWSMGYTGDPSTVIAFVDSGIDDSHPDLAGRGALWIDESRGDASPDDDFGHGTHVAGIALGSGQAGGVNPTTLRYSQSGLFPFVISFGTDPQPYQPFLIHVPGVPDGGNPFSFLWDATAKWGDTDGRKTGMALWVFQPTDDPASAVNDIGIRRLTDEITDTTGNLSLSGRPSGYPVPWQSTTSSGAKLNTSIFGSILRKTGLNTSSGSADHFSVATTLTAMNGGHFGAGDDYPLLSGVAPACRWACFRVGDGLGNIRSDHIAAALDDLAAAAAAHNIQVANVSITGDNQQTLRDKTNAAVNAGVFIAVSAGNEGPGGGLGDPARAGKAMTVAAATADGALTSYTTNGFTGGTDAGGDAIKPDIMAPGGSVSGGYVLSTDTNDADTWYGPDQRADDYTPLSGTSMAAPFVAGAAAVVIDAWQKTGHSWRFGSDADPLFVKMLLCATATESGKPRELNYANDETTPKSSPVVGGSANPKDGQEGYGLINLDAAVECLTRNITTPYPAINTFGAGIFDRRAMGGHLYLKAGAPATLIANGPTTLATLLCLYRSTPDANGNPVFVASAVAPAGFAAIQFTPPSTDVYYVVVKRVAGEGTCTLSVSSNSTFTPPDVQTFYASSVHTTSATLAGNVNPNGNQALAYFEYGPTTSYGHRGTTFSVPGTGARYISEALSGLPIAGTLHYRLVTTVGNARFEGPDQYLATWAPYSGDALQFDGAKDFVTLPNESAFDFPNQAPFTVEAWIRVEVWDKTWQAVITKGDSAWRIHRYGNGNMLSFGITGPAGNTDLPGHTNVADGQWHHVAAVYAPPTQSLYVDGKLEATSAAVNLAQNNFPVVIGENAQATGRYFRGQMDEVRIWACARTAAEIRAGMRRTLDGSESGLAAYLRFDDGSGLMAADTGNHQPLSPLSGSPLWTPSTAPLSPPLTTEDALTALKVAGGLQAAVSPDAAYLLDLSRDGVVDVNDAARIIRAAMGLDAGP